MSVHVDQRCSTTASGPSTTYELTDLQALEAEAIHIVREVTAEFSGR